MKKLDIPGSYLDVGSGTGKLARILASELPGIHITCLDSSDRLNQIALDLARKAEIRNFEIQTVVPFFMHLITAWKQ